MTTLGTIEAIHRYPVKSMMGESLNSSVVTTRGLAGDRGYALIDNDGRIGTAKIQRKWRPIFRSRSRYLEEPTGSEDLPPVEITLPDGERVHSSDGNINGVFTDLLGFDAQLITEAPGPLKLESPPLGQIPDDEDSPTVDFPVVNGFFDLGTLHLLTTATLAKLRELSPETRFEPRRFRPNMVVQSPPEVTGFAENDWPGQIVGIGDEVRIKVMMPSIRCVVTTLPQDDLPSEPSVLTTAAAHNNANVGVYALVEQGGTIRRGDEIYYV